MEEQTARRTNGGDCITSFANAVGNNKLLHVTHSWEVFSAVDDFVEAAVNDVLTVIQRRIKHDLWLFNLHRDQQRRPLHVLQVVKLGRVIAEVISSLQKQTRGHQTGSGHC